MILRKKYKNVHLSYCICVIVYENYFSESSAGRVFAGFVNIAGMAAYVIPWPAAA